LGLIVLEIANYIFVERKGIPVGCTLYLLADS